MDDVLSSKERSLLLKIAREAIEQVVKGNPLPALKLSKLPRRLKEPGATFVTLTLGGKLRGCIGTIEPYLPLVEDVRRHALAAALQDFRFPPVMEAELPDLKIEISRLTSPRLLVYSCPEELPGLLRPLIDGVVVKDGRMRATFLPQVWKTLSEPEIFLDHLCRKMGAPQDLWRTKMLEVSTYQVEEFHE